MEVAEFGPEPNQAAEVILVIGPLAGNEHAALGFVDKLAALLRRQPERLGDGHLTLVRDPNPDGRSLGERTNARRVDLNRNFPALNWRRVPQGTFWISGQTAASEPETRALVKLVKALKPDRVLIFTDDADKGLLASSGPATTWAASVLHRSGLPVAKHNPGRVSGSLAGWLGEDLNVPTLTLGVPHQLSTQTNWNRFGPGIVASLNRATLLNRSDFVSASPTGSPSGTQQSLPPTTVPHASLDPSPVGRPPIHPLYGSLTPLRPTPSSPPPNPQVKATTSPNSAAQAPLSGQPPNQPATDVQVPPGPSNTIGRLPSAIPNPVSPVQQTDPKRLWNLPQDPIPLLEP